MLLLSLLLSGNVTFVDASATGANDGSSWADAFTDLQSALALPPPSAPEIWIAAGTYRPSQTGDRAASFRVAGHELYGGFDGTESSLDQRAGLFDQTILDGDLLGDDAPAFQNRGDNSYHVAVVDAGGFALLDGLTIRGGFATGAGNDTGAGLWVKFIALAVANEVRFVDNYAATWGGGLHLDDVKSYFTRCTFLGNRSGVEGGGVFAVPFRYPFGIDFDRCRFLGNQSQTGGGVGGDGGNFRGCVFSGNRAHQGLGGGAIQAEWVLAVTNCTFFGNLATQAQLGGGAILYTGWSAYRPPISNSIFRQNADALGEGFASQIRVGPQCPYVGLRGCCVPEFHPTGRGAGNLRADPELVLPLGPDGVAGTLDDDLRLRVGSPCIDRGNDAFLMELAPVDLAGRPRGVDALQCGDGGVLDIGAYESQVVAGTTNYCAATPSSLGMPAIASGPCAWDLDAGDPAVSAGPVPPGGGLFFFGPDRDETPLGNGVLCVGGALRRTPFALPQGGVLASRIDLSDPPIAALLLPGTCWSFQAWYRDAAAGGAGFNLSDAIRVTFR